MNHFSVQELIDQQKIIVGDGYRAKNEELDTAGIPFARAGNIDGGFNFREVDKFPLKDLNKVGNKISKPGDIVFTSKGTVGRFAFVNEQTQQFVYSPQLCFWRSLDYDFLLPEFLYYWMSSREFINQVNAVKGQTDMADYVSLTDQKRMIVRIPDISIQKKIGLCLSVFDKKIFINGAINDTLELMAKAIFKEWFIDFGPVKAKAKKEALAGMDDETASLFPNEFADSELGQIPHGWKVGKLEEIAEVIGGGTPPTAERSYFCGPSTGISWLSPKDLSGYNWKYISEGATDITELGLKNSSARLLPAGTVLFSSRAPIGYIAIAEKEVCTNQGFKSLIPKNGCNTEFLYYLLKANVDFIEARASGSTFKEISGNGMKALPVVLPPKKLFETFEKVTTEFSKLQKELRHESDSLIKTRDLLLPKLISGEISLDNV